MLQLLLSLQRLDDKLSEVSKKKQSLPQKIIELDNLFKEKTEDLEELKNKLKNTLVEQRKLEKELNAGIEELKKKQNRIFEVKTNEEYRALLKEIEYTKVVHSDMEDRILHMFDEIEELEKMVKQQEEDLKRYQQDSEKEKARIREELESIDIEKEKFEKEREEICGQLSPELLSEYETLRSRRSGLAVVVVEKEICPGCHLYVPPQTINEVLQTGEIRHCPHCRRIIYCEI